MERNYPVLRSLAKRFFENQSAGTGHHLALSFAGWFKLRTAMEIREATLADIESIARIHVAGWRAAYRGQIPDTILENLNVEKRTNFWHGHLIRKPRGIFLAELDREIIGFCDLIQSRDRDSDPQTTAEITSIYVHPDYWRQGAGRALCKRALKQAQSESFATVTLWVLHSNVAAQKFYKAMGFLPDGTTKTDLLSNHELHEVRFRISL